MNRYLPALVISLLLHVGVFLLALIGWIGASHDTPVASVPVEIISTVPQHEMAAAPVDTQAVKTPEPVPAPPEPVPTPPPPTPQVQPIPTPSKAQAKPDTPPVKAPPDKNGLKKPTPPVKPQPDILGGILDNTPSKSQTRQQAQANTHPTQGASNYGAAPNDAGQKVALTALTDRISKLWTLNCDVPGSDQVIVKIRFMLSPNGRVISGPTWIDQRDDPVWQAAAGLAIAAVNKGQPYGDLPDGLYNQQLTINFDAKAACRAR